MPITLFHSISDDHDIVSNCIWLIYYLGKNLKMNFFLLPLSWVIQFCLKKMDEISAVAMWQESNVTTNAQRIIARHLSDLFGKRLIVPETCIIELGQNHVPLKSESIFLTLLD